MSRKIEKNKKTTTKKRKKSKKEKFKQIEKSKSKRLKVQKKIKKYMSSVSFLVIMDKMYVFSLYPIPDSQAMCKEGQL